MADTLKIKWLYIIAGVFVLLNTLAIAFEFYWLNLLPGAALIILLALVSMDKLIYLIVFFTPLSVILKDTDQFGVALSLPTEPLLFGVTLIFIFRYLYEGFFDPKIIRHPITIAIIFNLVWILITTITSEMSLVSIKYFLSRLWFVIPFFFVAALMFREKGSMEKYSMAYIISFTLVIIYTIVVHSQGGFAQGPAHTAMTPFYNDHTSYGAMLAMFIPLFFYFLSEKNLKPSKKLGYWVLFILFIVATLLSYTRAAWVSLGAALIVFLILRLRIKFFTLCLMGVGAVLAFFLFQDKIIMRLEKNKKASSTDFSEHVQSISNISTDASNKERINRWMSALRMFQERPFFGWGPGTYMFQYAPFQFSYEKTSISTNAGDRGNAHSEYIGPLAESGVLGMVSFLSILIASVYTGVRQYRMFKDPRLRGFSLAIFLGLLTYFVHGTLNNFLDTDKSSAIFWGFLAMQVVLDVFYLPGSEKTTAK